MNAQILSTFQSGPQLHFPIVVEIDRAVVPTTVFLQKTLPPLVTVLIIITQDTGFKKAGKILWIM